MGIHQGIVYEGSYELFYPPWSWKALGSPKLVLATGELLAFNKRLAWEAWPPPMGPSNLVFPLESDLVVCETLIPSICELSSPTSWMLSYLQMRLSLKL
jgi:hypothetical protein